MNNNFCKVGVGARVFATKDGNVIRVDIFENNRPDQHIEFYGYQAEELYKKLGEELTKLREEQKTP